MYFDDAGQALVSTGGSVSGLLRNPGYDDGVPGNAYDLDASSQLPAWKWYGGTNAGFISREHCKDGEQALVVTWPQNTMAQDWPAAGGVTYVASGYLFTPSDKKFNSDGSSYGRLEMVFYVGGDTNPAQDYIYYSARFTWQKPADQWIYFSVTGMAPPEAVVTGRLNCTIYSDDPGGDMDLAGVIYFDQLSVIQQGGMSDWEQWQMQNFGSTNAPGTGPVEDYDGDGYLNWSEFIAGTQPTNEGSYLSASSEQQQSSKTSLVIKWDSTSGRYYAVLRSSTGPGPGNMSMVASNIVATPPENVYIDDVGNAWQVYYYRIQVRTNQW
ncbi:MAG TPA: hypothetical protein EYP62_07830 [Kiritimatiellae bacterium]|nr:hypothetical protein [Kiritimatiellia bacterium]